MVTALYPGSFDPVTVGHVDVATRAAKVFEKLVVGVYDTTSKNLLFNTQERTKLMTDALAHLPNVEVVTFSGLVVRFAREINAEVSSEG